MSKVYYNGYTEENLLTLAIETHLKELWNKSDYAAKNNNKLCYEQCYNEHYAWLEYIREKNIVLSTEIMSRF